MKTDPHCIFCKIVAGQVPARRVYEDENLLAFPDINPAAPVHLLVVPKTHLVNLDEASAEHQVLLGNMLLLAPRLARQGGATNGYRVVFNNGADGGQEVFHMHMHILGGPRPWNRL